MLDTSPSPRWQRRPDARPEEILDAALEVFGAQGFAGARLEDIARHAGVSKGTLYLYFDSKDDVLLAVVEQMVDRILHEVRIAEITVAIDIRVAHRLDLELLRLRRAKAQRR